MDEASVIEESSITATDGKTYKSKIYNLDAIPVSVCRWTDVENVRAFYDFFKAREAEFE